MYFYSVVEEFLLPIFLNSKLDSVELQALKSIRSSMDQLKAHAD